MFSKIVFFIFVLIGSALTKSVCESPGAIDAATTAKLKKAGGLFLGCFHPFTDLDVITAEIEEAKHKGTLHELTKKYCDKTSKLRTCVRDVVDVVSVCFDQEMREHSEMVTEALDRLIDFACYNDGERIVSFITDKGIECYRNKSVDIQVDCLKEMRHSIMWYQEEKELTRTERSKELNDIRKSLSACLVKYLESCNPSTPANMTMLLLRDVCKGSLCPED